MEIPLGVRMRATNQCNRGARDREVFRCSQSDNLALSPNVAESRPLAFGTGFPNGHTGQGLAEDERATKTERLRCEIAQGIPPLAMNHREILRFAQNDKKVGTEKGAATCCCARCATDPTKSRPSEI